MDNEIKQKERHLEKLSLEDEQASKELSIAQKRALIAEAKEKYGSGWKKVLGMLKGNLRINQENVQTLYSQGVGASELRELSKPRSMRR